MSNGNVRHVVALFDFDGTRKVDCPQPLLLFRVGDVIEVTAKNTDCYRGRLGTREGWFPKVLVKRHSSGLSSSAVTTGSAPGATLTSQRSLGSIAPINKAAQSPTSPPAGPQSSGANASTPSPLGQKKASSSLSPSSPAGAAKVPASPRASDPPATMGVATLRKEGEPLKRSKSRKKSIMDPALTEEPIMFTKQSNLIPSREVVKSLDDWKGSDASHLPITKAELLAVTSEEGSYYVGTNLQGQTGKFPSSRVTVVASGADRGIGRTCASSVARLKLGATPEAVLSSKNLFAPNATQRNRVCRELIETEVAYNAFLNDLNKYKTAMEKSAWSADVPALFSNLDALLLVSDKLLAQFNAVAKTWSSATSSIAAPLLTLAPFLFYFVEYATSFNVAIKRLEVLMADAQFNTLLRGLKKDLDLPTLAVMPVQRVPRFKLLLEEAIRNTPDAHPDLPFLKEALAVVSALAITINESVRSSEKTQSLLEEGKHKEVLSEYARGDRTILMEVKGSVSVTIGDTKSTIGRLKGSVFLFSDALLVLLNLHVKDAREHEALGVWISDFSRVFWPTKLLYAKRVDDKTLSVVGPFHHITLKMKKGCGPLYDLLTSEIGKHSIRRINEPSRVGAYVWDDFKYDGEWDNDGLMHGNGSMALGHGVIYSGEFQHGHMTGAGKMKLSNGDVLIGPFVRGQLHGAGVVDYANGDKFSGTFVHGTRSGVGTFTSPSSSLEYTGAWADDNAHGTGVLTVGSSKYSGDFAQALFTRGDYLSPEGVLYSGSFTGFKLCQGQARVVYADGSVYTGNLRDSLREGHGVMEWADKSRFEGEWKNDRIVTGTFAGGPGHYLKSYTGAFDDHGFPHAKGVGKAVLADGSVFKGSFRHGAIDKGDLKLPSGHIVTGKWRGGTVKGKTALTMPDDDVFEGVCEGTTNMLVVKNAPALRLPQSRPTFPLNIAMGALGSSKAK